MEIAGAQRPNRPSGGETEIRSGVRLALVNTTQGRLHWEGHLELGLLGSEGRAGRNLGERQSTRGGVCLGVGWRGLKGMQR